MNSFDLIRGFVRRHILRTVKRWTTFLSRLRRDLPVHRKSWREHTHFLHDKADKSMAGLRGMRRVFAVALWLAVPATPGIAQALPELPSPLGLGDVIRLAGERRDEIEAARARTRAGEALPTIVSGLEDPMLSPSIDHYPFISYRTVRPSPGMASRFVTCRTSSRRRSEVCRSRRRSPAGPASPSTSA